MRYVCKSHVACLQFVFSYGRLVVPHSRHGFTGTPRSFFAPHRDVPLLTEARREEIRMTTMTKQFISSAFVVAFSFLSSKADIDLAQEQYDAEGNLRGTVIHNPTAAIGEGEKQVKTPWLIMTPDGKSAFANDFTTNAISVVSEDGTNYYAHIEDENGGRTNVIHFTVNERGIPSKNGDVIDTTESGEENNAEKMKIRKLIGVKDGYLYFYPFGQFGTSLIYNPNPKEGEERVVIDRTSTITNEPPSQQKCMASFSNSREVVALCNIQYVNNEGNTVTNECIKDFLGQYIYTRAAHFPSNFDNMLVVNGGVLGNVYTGDSDGNVCRGGKDVVQLPGRISSISSSDTGDIFVTTPKTNAFYNLNLGQYNVATDQNGNVKPMIPKTKDGLIKVIDNRRNGGKFLCITTKGAHTIDE